MILSTLVCLLLQLVETLWIVNSNAVHLQQALREHIQMYFEIALSFINNYTFTQFSHYFTGSNTVINNYWVISHHHLP
jgi:hypothetical protein